MTTENNQGAAGAVGATGAVGAAGAGATWWNGFDDETKGYLQNKGLSTKTAEEAFVTASKMHRDAEKLIGAPASELIRLPKDQTSPEWAGVYKRLGALEAPDKYTFEGVKHTGDKPLNPALTDALRKAAFDGHLSAEAANVVAREVVKHIDASESQIAAELQSTLDSEKKALKDNWGANEAANMVIAQNAAQALGVSKEAVVALANQVGYSKVMEMFRQIGTKIGEDRFVTNGGANNNGIMTKEQAIATKAELMRDNEWVKRYLNNGVEERRKMEALNRIITNTAA